MTETDEDVQQPEADTSPAAKPKPDKPPRFPLTVSRTVAAAVAGVLALSLAAAIAFALLFVGKYNADDARAQALSTARNFAAAVSSYDYRELDQNIATVLDGSTGEFKKQYAGAENALRQLVTEAKAVASGTVREAGVKSVSEDRAEVLVFVDQSVTEKAEDKPRVDRNRMLLVLQRQDDRWLVSDVHLR